MHEAPLLLPPDGLKHRRLAELDHDQLIADMAASMRLMLQSGTVAFADFREQGVHGVQALVKAAAGSPILPVALGRFAALPPHSDEDLAANIAPLPPSYREEIDQVLDVASGFSLVTPNDTTDVGMLETSRAVRARRKLLAVHASEIELYRQVSFRHTGRSDVARAIEYLAPDFLVHLTVASPEDLDTVAEAEVPVVVCPRTQGTLGNGLPPVFEMLKRGVTVAIGSDNVMLTNPDLLRDLDYLSRATKAASTDPAALSPRKLLQMVTVSAAKATHLDDRLGWLAPGKDATFVVFDTETDNLRSSEDPLASVVQRADRSDIAAVVIQGEVVAGSIGQATGAHPGPPQKMVSSSVNSAYK
jgi:cytosine/adenosine deaminase-related metal-dependent hydrolase